MYRRQPQHSDVDIIRYGRWGFPTQLYKKLNNPLQESLSTNKCNEKLARVWTPLLQPYKCLLCMHRSYTCFVPVSVWSTFIDGYIQSTPLKINMEQNRWWRSCSFLSGWLEGSMLIFQGVHVNYLSFVISFVPNKIESLPFFIPNTISLAAFILLIPTYSIKMVSTILLIRLILVCTPTRMVDFYGKLLVAGEIY